MFFLGHAIFEAIGFGLFLGVLWVAVVIYVVWRQGLGSLSQWWNLWLGTIMFTLALWVLSISDMGHFLNRTLWSRQRGEVAP